MTAHNVPDNSARASTEGQPHSVPCKRCPGWKDRHHTCHIWMGTHETLRPKKGHHTHHTQMGHALYTGVPTAMQEWGTQLDGRTTEGADAAIDESRF